MRRGEHEVDVHLLPVLEHEADRVREKKPQDDQPQIEPRLPAIRDLVGVDAGAAKKPHAEILRLGGGGGRERARHEPRLRRRGELPDRLGTERRADRLAGEGAESGAPEIAISARWRRSFAHPLLCSRKSGPLSKVRS